MGLEDLRDAGLVLGLGSEGWAADSPPVKRELHRRARGKASVQVEERESRANPPPPSTVEPSLTLSLSDGAHRMSPAPMKAPVEVGSPGRAWQSPDPHSLASSFSTAYPSSNVKVEKDVLSEEAEAEVERVTSSRASDEEGSARKKLRLTKEQSALLEDRFKEHSSLNPKQKQALAKQLNLRPRQVEVWFQNRRARTKLKQTEVDCEFLKRCCESLTDENRRLQKELQELRALTFAPPLYMQLPAATLTMCPSCEGMAAASAGDAGKGGISAGGPFAKAPKPHFYSPYSTAHPPSAAC